MRNIYKIRKSRVLHGSVFLLTVLIFCACYLKIVGLTYEKRPYKAGEPIEIIADVEVQFNDKANSEKLIIAIRTPRSWKAVDNTEIVFECIGFDEGQGVWNTMSLIPNDVSPKNQPGLTWPQALLKKLREEDPNVLDDMEWVAFQSDRTFNLDLNAIYHMNVKVKTITGPENLKAKIGVFVNHSGDGLGGNEPTDMGGIRWNAMWTDCIEVVEGEGDVIDFCDFHFNMHTLGKATQNDIITIKYIGDVDTNDLMDEQDIYLCATAITTDGVEYKVDSRLDVSKMRKESKYGKIFSLTFWPENYFHFNKDEVIDRIEYYFTDKTGLKYVSLYDDEHKGEVTPSPKPNHSFVYKFDNSVNQ